MNAFDEFCQASVDLLDALAVPYLVIGGVAVAAVGEPRTTGDVDVLAFVSMDVARTLIGRAAAAGFSSVDDETEQLLATGTLRFHRGRFQLDVVVASLPFEDRARERAVRRRLFDREVPMPTPEDLIVFKVLAGREKDLLDAVGVARRHAGRLDLDYLNAAMDELCDIAEDSGPRVLLEQVFEKASR